MPPPQIIPAFDIAEDRSPECGKGRSVIQGGREKCDACFTCPPWLRSVAIPTYQPSTPRCVTRATLRRSPSPPSCGNSLSWPTHSYSRTVSGHLNPYGHMNGDAGRQYTRTQHRHVIASRAERLAIPPQPHSVAPTWHMGTHLQLGKDSPGTANRSARVYGKIAAGIAFKRCQDLHSIWKGVIPIRGRYEKRYINRGKPGVFQGLQVDFSPHSACVRQRGEASKGQVRSSNIRPPESP